MTPLNQISKEEIEKFEESVSFALAKTILTKEN